MTYLMGEKPSDFRYRIYAGDEWIGATSSLTGARGMAVEMQASKEYCTWITVRDIRIDNRVIIRLDGGAEVGKDNILTFAPRK